MILVTGATGFIGRHLVELLIARGRQVRAAFRHSDRARNLPQGVEWIVVGDLGGPVDWDSALVGVDTVVHLAARVHVLTVADDDERAFRAINVGGTERLAEASVRAHVGRLIFASSVGALGKGTVGGEARTEESPCTPGDAYGRSKLEAEQVLHEIARHNNLEIVIVRPPSVYGAGGVGTIHELFTLVDRGIPLPFGLVSNRHSFVYVGNLVDAILRVMNAPEVAGHIFHVADSEVLSSAELATRIGLALGRPARILPVPPGMLLAAGSIGDLVSRAAQIRLPVNSKRVESLLASQRVNCDKIRLMLGWEPPWTMDQGLAITAQWYKESARLPKRIV